MKTTLIFALMMSSAVAMASTPIVKKVPVDHVYIPAGFDNNDNVEVIVTGFLPNLCHKAPSAKVSVDGSKVNVTLTSLYYHASNPFCPEMVVPFTKTVTLGVMDKGNYEVVVNDKTPWTKKSEVKIAESTSNAIDEFNYAYVEYIQKELGKKTVTLKGYNPSDCFVLDRIDYTSNGVDAYSVLPKMKQVSDFCPMKMVPFEYEWEVPSDLNTQQVLLHVRTMDGNSVNTIFEKFE